MVLQHGARQLGINCANLHPSGAARVFFSTFYQWSQAGCYASERKVNRAIHTGNSPKSSDAVEPISISNIKATKYRRWEPSPEILSQDIRRIMRSLPHSVVVLTTSTREKNERIDQLIREMCQPSRNPRHIKPSGRASHSPFYATAIGNSVPYDNAKEVFVPEDRRAGNLRPAVTKEANIEETSSTCPSVGPRRIPKERQIIRGFNLGRKNYYGLLEEEWESNLEPPIRQLEQNSYKDYRAMTLSSFATVCLSDPPMISFNIRSPSKTLDALRRASGKFMIHILEANRAGAEIASAFSRGGGGTEGFDILQVEDYHDFMGKNTRKSIALPVITGPGVKKVLYCQIGNGISRSFNRKDTHAFDVLPVGDHHVVFAKVLVVLDEPRTGVEEVEGGKELEDEKWHGLSYADGRYRGVGGVIDLEPGQRLE